MVKNVIFLKNSFLSRKKEILFTTFLVILMVLLSESGYANHFNLGIGEFFEQFKSLVIYLFRFIAFCAISGIVIAAFTGKANWVIVVTVLLASIVMANIDKILTWLHLTGGVMM